jgi:hypothetical protein
LKYGTSDLLVRVAIVRAQAALAIDRTPVFLDPETVGGLAPGQSIARAGERIHRNTQDEGGNDGCESHFDARVNELVLFREVGRR